MVEFKLVIGDPKTGKSAQKTIAEDMASGLIGKKIGESVDGGSLGLAGYEFQITGGSDYCGFPMRKGINLARKKILAGKSVGCRLDKRGIRIRKTVAGESVHEKTAQINLKITKYGAQPIAGEPKAAK